MTRIPRRPGMGFATDAVRENSNTSVERLKAVASTGMVVFVLALCLFVSAAAGAMAGYAAGMGGAEAKVEAGEGRGISLVPWAEPNRAGRAARSSDRFTVLREALDFLEEEYIGEIPGGDALNQAAIDGILAELGDRYSVLVRPDGDFPGRGEADPEGIGLGARLAWLPDRKRFLVTQTFEGLPAAAAGLRAGDLVVSVDGEPVSWLGREAVLASLRAPAGTEVQIGYRRDEEAFDASITLRKVEIPNVDHKVLGSASNIGYIRMHSVSESGAAGLGAALTELTDFGVDAVILDLRSTVGGSTAAAVRVAGMLTGPRLVAIGEYTDGVRTELKAADAALLPPGLPLAVLVDRYSAGASELVAGAVRDHGAGLVIGETTYGSGSGQTDFVLGDGSRLRVSDHLWHTPTGWRIHRQGLIPDVPVALDEPDGNPEAADPFLQAAEMFLVLPPAATISGH